MDLVADLLATAFLSLTFHEKWDLVRRNQQTRRELASQSLRVRVGDGETLMQ